MTQTSMKGITPLCERRSRMQVCVSARDLSSHVLWIWRFFRLALGTVFLGLQVLHEVAPDLLCITQNV